MYSINRDYILSFTYCSVSTQIILTCKRLGTITRQGRDRVISMEMDASGRVLGCHVSRVDVSLVLSPSPKAMDHNSLILQLPVKSSHVFYYWITFIKPYITPSSMLLYMHLSFTIKIMFKLTIWNRVQTRLWKYSEFRRMPRCRKVCKSGRRKLVKGRGRTFMRIKSVLDIHISCILYSLS